MAFHSPSLRPTERRSKKKVSAGYEDRGLFKRPAVKVAAELTPVMQRNSLNDLVVTAYMTSGRQFEVIFAGRRSPMAASLVTHIVGLRDASMKAAKARGEVDYQVADLRIPVRLDGSWRTRTWVDHTGFQSRMHQLVAARWQIAGADDGGATYGAPPLED